MPNVNDLKKWLKMSDLKVGDIVHFSDEGIIKEFQFEDKQTKEKRSGKALQCQVSINGGDLKDLTLNNVSIQNLTKAWGDDTHMWVNKKAEAKPIKMMSFGKMIDGIYLEAIN